MRIIVLLHLFLFSLIASADQEYQSAAIKGLWTIDGRFERITHLVYVDDALVLFACDRRIRKGYAYPVRCRKSRGLRFDPVNDRMDVVLDERYHIRVDPQSRDEFFLGDKKTGKIILGHRVTDDLGRIRFDE